MVEKTYKVRDYWMIFGKKPGSKNLRDPAYFKELYREDANSMSFSEKINKVEEQLEKEGYKTLIVKVTTFGNLEPDDTLEVKVTKSYLKPSPEGTIGSDFEL